jgi:hypothetical protein
VSNAHSSAATLANNYPIEEAGILKVSAPMSGTTLQEYYPLIEGKIYRRYSTDSAASWSTWISIGAEPPQPVPVHATFTGDGSTTTFDAGVTLPAATALMVSVGGIIQTAVTDYTTSGTEITFVTAPPAPQSGLDTPNIQIMGTVY